MKKVRKILLVCLILMVFGMLQSQNAYAEKIGMYKLSDSGINSKYDVTGDGVPDKVEIKKLNRDHYEYCGFEIIINGKTVLKDDDITYYIGLEVVFIQTKDHGYFLISNGSGEGMDIIYEYAGGRLKKCCDLFADIEGKLGWCCGKATVSSVKAQSIKLKTTGQTSMLGETKLSFELKVGKKGKLSLAKKTIGVSCHRLISGNGRFYHPKYLVTAKKIQVYRSVEGTKKAFCIKKGTKVKITKASIKGKTPMYYCITKSGKKGWIKDEGILYLFKDLAYAG